MKRTIRKIVIIAFYLGLLIGLIVYNKQINKYIVEKFIFVREVEEYEVNDYAKETSYNYISTTSDFIVTSKTNLLNAIYTIVDSGVDEFTFYCDNQYTECLTDVESLSDTTTTLTVINNFISPFNSYNKLYISTNSMGKINIIIDKLYSVEEILYTKNKINMIVNEVITSEMTIREKIKAFHDYIINTTIYDEARSDEIKNKIYTNNVFNSHKASGVLENHIALCSGYTDVMAVFLDTIGVKNFKVSNNDHIWNAIYLDGAWYHLDLTWDDPVTDNGTNIIIYDFFLITNTELFQKEAIQHSYDANVYSEIATS